MSLPRRVPDQPVVPVERTASELARLLPTLNAATFEYGMAALCDGKAATLSHILQLKMAVFEWLLHLGIFEKAEAVQLAEHLHFDFEVLFKQLEHHHTYAHLLKIAENRFAAWPTLPGWYDVILGRPVTELPAPAVSYVVCDMTALWLRLERWAAGGSRRNDAAAQRQVPAGAPGGV